jgi:hypothetical protein
MSSIWRVNKHKLKKKPQKNFDVKQKQKPMLKLTQRRRQELQKRPLLLLIGLQRKKKLNRKYKKRLRLQMRKSVKLKKLSKPLLIILNQLKKWKSKWKSLKAK